MFAYILTLINKQTFSDAANLLAFKGLNHTFCVFTEVFWRKMVHTQLLSNKTTPNFQLEHRTPSPEVTLVL